MAPYHVYGPSILIILILFWQLLIRYLFRLTSMYELLFLSVAFFFVSGLHKIIDFFLTYGFSDYNWFVQVRERKSLFIKLLISRLLRKKHLSTVISNNMEPPSIYFNYDCFWKSFSLIAFANAANIIICVSTQRWEQEEEEETDQLIISFNINGNESRLSLENKLWEVPNAALEALTNGAHTQPADYGWSKLIAMKIANETFDIRVARDRRAKRSSKRLRWR